MNPSISVEMTLNEFKVVVLGEKSVGKTSLALRYLEGHFAEKQLSTIGAYFLSKKVTYPDNSSGKMQLWDTAGQERFRSVAPMYYKNTDAAIVCYEVEDDKSFDKMKDWVSDLQNGVSDLRNLVLVVCCTKIDRTREVGTVTSLSSRGREYAGSLKCEFFETSAKENTGIDDLFQHIVKEVSSRRSHSEEIQ